jgi:RNA polymerase sigma factor (TIGR02999 family)
MSTDEDDAPSVAELVAADQAGDELSVRELMPLVYQQLRRLAKRFMSHERPNHTLQATAVVNEAFIRCAGAGIHWRDPEHFFCVCAATMRRILVDHAKRRRRFKHGGAVTLHSLIDENIATSNTEELRTSVDVVALDAALAQFEKMDPRSAKLIELRYFAGLTIPETTELLRISESTATRDIRVAKAWLMRAILREKSRLEQAPKKPEE